MGRYEDKVLSLGPELFAPMLEEPGQPAEIYGTVATSGTYFFNDGATKNGGYWNGFTSGRSTTVHLSAYPSGHSWDPRAEATYVAWFRHSNITSLMSVMGREDTQSYQEAHVIDLDRNSSYPGSVVLKLFGSGGVRYNDKADGEWHFAVWSTSSDTYRYSLDGSNLYGSTNLNNTSTGRAKVSQNVYFGSGWSSRQTSVQNPFVGGDLKGVARFQKVLSQEEVNSLYTAGHFDLYGPSETYSLWENGAETPLTFEGAYLDGDVVPGTIDLVA